MAANKLHLRNVNKDYKLEATDKRTNEGRIVYKNTKTGELHSELSMTLEMPEGSGNWINVPSLINGRVYNVQGVIDMLNAGKITPNSTGHATEDAAVEAAIFRSNNLLDDVGISLKPNNEVDLKNNDPKIVKAFQPAYTSGSGANAEIEAAAEAALASDQQTERLTAIMNNQDLEKQDDYYKYYPNSPRNTDPNWSGTPQPERILNKATQYLDPDNQARLDAAEAAKIAERESIIGQAMSAYGPRTGPEVPKPGSRAGSSANLSMGVNQDKHHVSRDRYADMAVNEAENKFQNQDTRGLPNKGSYAGSSTNTIAEVNQDKHHISKDRYKLKELAAILDKRAAEKEDDYYDAKKPRTNIWGDNAVRYWDGWFKGPGGKKAIQNKDYGMTISAADQAIFDKAKSIRFPGNEDASFDSNTVYDMGVSDDGIFPGLPRYNAGPPRRGSKGDSKKSNSVTQQFGPDERYIGVDQITPNNQKKLPPKDVKPDYGDMPGFKLPPKDDKGKSTGNYWSVDETSPFWQTDAGYEKAMQVWGEKPGWVKPGYRPKKKELDINAIKKWFTPSK